MDFLFRTIELAAMADSRTFPNPKVGAVVVYDGKIIGEGYHQQAGGAHAEVHAIDAVRDKGLLPFSTLYVSLEPCNHHGKTPPCTDYILHHKIPKVVIGISDSNPMVAGTGIARLRAAGVEVIEHSITEPFWALNEIFFTNQSEQRPYIHLKWAESRDGFIAPLPAATFPITGMAANMLSHQLRAHHHAIMVGTNTAAIDNPRLDVRYAYGKSPLRIVWDTKGRLPRSLHLFQDGKPTLVIGKPRKDLPRSVDFFIPDVGDDIRKTCERLYKEKGICSIMVEGGSQLLQQFLDADYVDAIWKFTGNIALQSGIHAPIHRQPFRLEKMVGKDRLSIF